MKINRDKKQQSTLEANVDKMSLQLADIVYKNSDGSNFTEADYANETDAETNGKLYIVFPN